MYETQKNTLRTRVQRARRGGDSTSGIQNARGSMEPNPCVVLPCSDVNAVRLSMSCEYDADHDVFQAREVLRGKGRQRWRRGGVAHEERTSGEVR
jgi:hypothetical protein